MPAGISHPGFGYATFRAIKFAGYTAAAHFLSMSYDRDVSAWKVGAVRTLIGMAAGAAYFGLWFLNRSQRPSAGRPVLRFSIPLFRRPVAGPDCRMVASDLAVL
jgi:hypothetical protein